MEQNKTNIPPVGNSNPNSPLKKGPKFNLYWIYGAFAIALIALNFWDKGMGARPKEETFQTINKNFISFKKNDHLVLSNNKIIPLGNTYKASINNL